MSVNNTFKSSALANVAGTKTAVGQTLTVEFLAANPTNVAGVSRVWFNTADFKLYTYDGTTQRSSVAMT